MVMARGPGDEYEAGVCNIGPSEIARRRTLAYLGLLATLGFLALLIIADVPTWARFSVALPAWGTAVSYLQARRRFCAGFAAQGVFNFGELGAPQRVVDPRARAADRRHALEIVIHGFLVGVAAGAAAVLLPL
jgi:hypothetical protein